MYAEAQCTASFCQLKIMEDETKEKEGKMIRHTSPIPIIIFRNVPEKESWKDPSKSFGMIFWKLHIKGNIFPRSMMNTSINVTNGYIR